MSKFLGVTLSRTLRQEFNAGKKLPKSIDLEFLAPHYVAITKVVFPGKTNGRLLIEMTPKQLKALIEQERGNHEDLVTQRFDTERKRKNLKIKKLKAELQHNHEQIESLTQTAAGSAKRTRKIEKELDEKLAENHQLWNESIELNSILEDTSCKLSDACALIRDQSAEIAKLNEHIKRQKRAMEQYNIASNDLEDRSFNTGTTVLEGSIVKVTTNKPVDGSYGATQ
ncbi:hypothetical protein [Pseudomonas cichorii]|nr:hypothetical protein [Pseudomonas cichorii]